MRLRIELSWVLLFGVLFVGSSTATAEDKLIIHHGTLAFGKYPFVVGIYSNKKLICSGSIIAERTILTAAHCISGHEKDIQNGLFTYSGDAALFLLAPAKIDSGIFPKEETGLPVGEIYTSKARLADGTGYDASKNLHDIGLLFTHDKILLPIASFDANLNWVDFVRNSQISAKKRPELAKELVFVGYGLDPGGNTPNDVKLFQKWGLSQIDDWKIYYDAAVNNPKLPNTCNGDSGGPSLYDDKVIVAVTSTGDAACTSGASTRVDVHKKWILDHIVPPHKAE